MAYLSAYIWSETPGRRFRGAAAWVTMLYCASTLGHTPFFRWFDLIVQTHVSNTSSSQTFNNVQWRWPLKMRSLRGFEDSGQGTSADRPQYSGKAELSIYTSWWMLTFLISAGDRITSLLCCNGYRRYTTAFVFS
jgi:hypothetical protein